MIPAADLIERFSIPPEALEEHLSLLNLVNFGGGCYAVYAELHGDEVGELLDSVHLNRPDLDLMNPATWPEL